MSSFYGGKRGASLEIKQSYADYNAMIQDQDNIDYNEYVITTNNNILYRRIQNGYQEITKLTVSTGESGGGSGGGTEISGPTYISPYESIKAQGSLDEENYREATFMTAEMVNAGKGELKYNSFYDKSTGTSYVGFQIPYPDISFNTENQNITFEKINSSNPFKMAWRVSITGGEGGGGGSSEVSSVIYFENLRTLPAAGVTATIYNPINNQPYDLSELISRNATIVVYDKRDTTNNTTVTYFFGEYNNIKSIDISEKGKFVITDINNNKYEYTFNDIASVKLENGVFTVTYTNGNVYTSNITYVENIVLDEDTQKLKATYSNQETDFISDELNIIKEVAVTEDSHLLIYYSGPAFKQKYDTISYNGKDGWIDYGIIRSDNGIYVGKNILPSEILGTDGGSLTQSKTINYLNRMYPQGLIGDNLQGKLVTVGYNTENKSFYAFDYSANTWYFLSDSTSSSSNVSNLSDTNYIGPLNTSADILEQLPNGCTWFVTQEV